MSTKPRRQRHTGDASNGDLRKKRAKKPAPAGQEVSAEEHFPDNHSQPLPSQIEPARQEVNAEERFQLIQVCAYSLWEQAGRPGEDAARERFWCEAETEILASPAAAE